MFSQSNLMKSSTNDAAVRPVPRPQSQQLHQRLRGETSGLTDGHGTRGPESKQSDLVDIDSTDKLLYFKDIWYLIDIFVGVYCSRFFAILWSSLPLASWYLSGSFRCWGQSGPAWSSSQRWSVHGVPKGGFLNFEGVPFCESRHRGRSSSRRSALVASPDIWSSNADLYIN